jgi:hypothetical protein
MVYNFYKQHYGDNDYEAKKAGLFTYISNYDNLTLVEKKKIYTRRMEYLRKTDPHFIGNAEYKTLVHALKNLNPQNAMREQMNTFQDITVLKKMLGVPFDIGNEYFQWYYNSLVNNSKVLIHDMKKFKDQFEHHLKKLGSMHTNIVEEKLSDRGFKYFENLFVKERIRVAAKNNDNSVNMRDEFAEVLKVGIEGFELCHPSTIDTTSAQLCYSVT